MRRGEGPLGAEAAEGADGAALAQMALSRPRLERYHSQMTVRNRYLLLALPLFALALAACSWQGVTPAAAHNGAPSPVGYPAKHDGRYKVIYKF